MFNDKEPGSVVKKVLSKKFYLRSVVFQKEGAEGEKTPMWRFSPPPFTKEKLLCHACLRIPG